MKRKVIAPDIEKIKRALKDTVWAVLKNKLGQLSDAELIQANELERLTRRRKNVMYALVCERKRRDGRVMKQRSVRSESNL